MALHEIKNVLGLDTVKIPFCQNLEKIVQSWCKSAPWSAEHSTASTAHSHREEDPEKQEQFSDLGSGLQ